MNKSGHFLFHDLLKKLRLRGVEKKHLLCAVSGGMDSMVLLSLLCELRSVLGLKLSVVHVHHGAAEVKTQTRFRDRALKQVKCWCVKNSLPFYGFELVSAAGQKAGSFETTSLAGLKAALLDPRLCGGDDISLGGGDVPPGGGDAPAPHGDGDAHNRVGDDISPGSRDAPPGSDNAHKVSSFSGQSSPPKKSSPSRGSSFMQTTSFSQKKSSFPGTSSFQQTSSFPRKRESTPHFVFKIESPSSTTEAGLRSLRYRVFKVLFQQVGADFLVLAHHADDLLQTRLMRLIRGSGPVGLRAMSFQRGPLLRPLLFTSRKHLEDFATRRQLKWTEDPSNHHPHHNFRNWIRHKWLKDLEDKKPGAKKALFRSLALMVGKQNPGSLLSFYQQKGMDSEGIHLPLLEKLGEGDKSRVLALFIRQKGFKNYSFSHVQELLKRLKSKKTRPFYPAGQGLANSNHPLWWQVKAPSPPLKKKSQIKHRGRAFCLKILARWWAKLYKPGCIFSPPCKNPFIKPTVCVKPKSPKGNRGAAFSCFREDYPSFPQQTKS